MHDVEDALAQLGEAIGLGKLSLDASGNAAFRVDDRLSVYLMKIGDHEMEVVTPLVRFGTEASASLLYTLLQANAPGADVGSGRLAMDPNSGGILYEERFDVRDFDVAGLLDRLMRYLRRAAAWDAPETVASVIAASEPVSAPAVGEEADDDFDAPIDAETAPMLMRV